MAFFYELEASDASFSTAHADVTVKGAETSTETKVNPNENTPSSELVTEQLIGDLALILICGAISTVIFKKLKQPLVLGYIVAGFLVGPHFLLFPSVANEANIDFWAQIGIIALLFSLGLEFSFKKLLNVGGTAVTTTTLSVTCMMSLGYGVGKFLGFTSMNALFLGAMISMSSTTIIIKALNDLNLNRRRFVPVVFGVLICEDLFAVLLMVILSSIAINNSFEGTDLLMSVLKLVSFLIIWFIIGVGVIPPFFRRYRKIINDEILLILAMGLCFLMAIFSVFSGFSLALGAFLMGSVLAGTCEAEHINKAVKPIKDLFGAVFFISVGMMVNPGIIAEYIGPILLLSATVIVGKITFITFGMLLNGQPLKIAMESGFSLTQIGEFAFIIATLGMSLGVIDPTLYPIIVAVSVVTTFFSPYFIKFAEPAYNKLLPHIPKQMGFIINRYSKEAAEESETKAIWKNVISKYAWRIILYSTLIVGIETLSKKFAFTFLIDLWGEPGKAIATALTIAVIAPFVLALAYPNITRKQRAKLKEKSRMVNVPIMVLATFKVLLAFGYIFWFLTSIYPNATGIILSIASFILLFIFFSKKVKKQMKSLEHKFVANLNERELRKTGKANNIVSDMHVAYMTVGYDCPFVGERLGNSNIRKEYGVNVVSIQRGSHTIPVPNSNTRIFPGDLLGVIGSEQQIDHLIPIIENGIEQYEEGNAHEVIYTHMLIPYDSVLIGESTQSINLRNRYSSLLVAIQRGENEYLKPNGNELFMAGDILWLVGDISKIEELKHLKKLPDEEDSVGNSE